MYFISLDYFSLNSEKFSVLIKFTLYFLFYGLCFKKKNLSIYLLLFPSTCLFIFVDFLMFFFFSFLPFVFLSLFFFSFFYFSLPLLSSPLATVRRFSISLGLFLFCSFFILDYSYK